MLPLNAIYLYTKFHFNANSNFKVICQTRYLTDRRTKRRLYAYPLGSVIMWSPEGLLNSGFLTIVYCQVSKLMQMFMQERFFDS